MTDMNELHQKIAQAIDEVQDLAVRKEQQLTAAEATGQRRLKKEEELLALIHQYREVN